MTSEPPRGSENASAEGASRESPRDSEKPSDARRERSDPRDGDHDEFYTDGGRDDIPLNITGHEEREPPGESSSETDSSAGDTPRDAESEASVLEFSEDEASDADVDADEAGDDADDDEVEPVELLVQLAKDGEIDPWDIDVVRVTDKFLEAIEDADLRTSGRALFYASVLLRMKSDELFATDEPEEEELPPWEAPFADEGAMEPEGDDGGAHPPGFDPVESLEAEMERRLERKQARGKPETLDELVRELRSAERDSWWKESRSYDTSESPQGYDRGVQELDYHANDDFRVDDEPTSDDVTHTTHEEDIEAVIDDVEAELEVQYDEGREEVLYAEIEAVGGTRVMTYLALLFLAHRGRIRLEQDDLFGDLWIQNAAAETDADEAIAD
ncbi:chromosome segregation and condensation protein ScpA [Haloterrigena turkmenica DSM 5511]|uniref:Chromosome segregation and condensation protein ScpA n=1 Tax=Haloterrigena turkmenica (strain ATCC 51198 / DSM 5511 / JCM 9101 / NCIMB 13204 / VKM B-1734 / 4k) TaxID=543526 RepID=D2RPW9_HALTV|nr:ScpA family protein [Haloterrigena turkmenica]ADB60228.1 chromosome segregation and condensation protein ScpA [Haloterrigena turkmenica DSM 5511]